MKRIVLFLLLISTSILSAQSMKIGLSSIEGGSSAVFQVNRASYEVLANGNKLFSTNGETSVRLSGTGSQVKLEYQGRSYGPYSKVLFSIESYGGEFILKNTSRSKREYYQDNLIVKSKSNELRFINEIELDHYVSGVVEAESGGNRELEFYKVQAIISRTYALSNKRKHEREGFHLCDEVHCQAYHGKSKYEAKIPVATEQTENFVLVDHNINLITTAFHSNCGGHTLNAEKVWSRPLPYLIGRPDTFCLAQAHSHWEKRMNKELWKIYLQSKIDSLNTDSLNYDTALAYFPGQKEIYFKFENHDIPVTEIRRDLNLKSAWFSIHEEEDTVLFIGRGFGHSVGLCQEGAIHMAELGYTYRDILHFYYTDVHLIDLSKIRFFRN